MKVSAIIVAGGKGKRMMKQEGKQFALLSGKPVVASALAIFNDCEKIDEIVLVVNKDEEGKAKEMITEFKLDKVIKIAYAGEERHNSVASGLNAVSQDPDIIVIHDGARPLIEEKVIVSSIEAAEKFGAAVVGVPAKDTVKTAAPDEFVDKTPARSFVWQIQTPQTFKAEIIRRAYEKVEKYRDVPTDDSTLVEALGYRVKLVKGSYDNIKITTPEDLLIAEAILKGRG